MFIKRQRGVTMVELVIFIVVVSIAVAGILGVIGYSTSHSADPVRRKQALMIAESLLEEVEQSHFTNCDPNDANFGTGAGTCASLPEGWGPETGNARPYDNVNDYVSAPLTTLRAFDANGVLVDANGSGIAGTGYVATLKITPESLGGITPVGNAGTVGDSLRLTVTVSYGSDAIVLEGYRTRYSPNL